MKEANSRIYENAQEILKIEATMIIDFFFFNQENKIYDMEKYGG